MRLHSGPTYPRLLRYSCGKASKLIYDIAQEPEDASVSSAGGFQADHPPKARWFNIRAIQDYSTTIENERSFKRGDVLYVRHMRDESANFYVIKERLRGTKGGFIFVPKEYFEIIDEPSRNRFAKTFSKIGSYLGTSTKDSGSFDGELGGPSDFPEIPGEELRSPNLNQIREQFDGQWGRPPSPHPIISETDSTQSPVQSSVDQSDFGPSLGARSSKADTGFWDKGTVKRSMIEKRSHATSSWDCCKCATSGNSGRQNCFGCGHSQCSTCSPWLVDPYR